MSNFVSYANATTLMTEIGNRIKRLTSAYVFKGNILFADLPSSLTRTMGGFTYNINEDFTTDARFVEGAGKSYPAGTNVSVADLSTDSYNAATPEGTEDPKSEGWYERSGSDPDFVYTLTEDETVDSGKTYYVKVTNVNVKYDVLGNFIDIASIYALIADDFSDAVAYEVGDVVLHEGALYQFNTDHAIGDWEATEVDVVDVVDLIKAAEPDSLTTEQVDALVGLLS